MKIELREQEVAHVKEFYKHTSNHDVMKYMYRNPTSLEEEIDKFLKQDASILRKVIYVDDCYVGDIWCHSMHETPICDGLLSCCIFDQRVWNKGVASKALQLLLALLKAHDVTSVGAFLYAKNLGSLHVLEKLAFTREKTFEEEGNIAYFYKKCL